MPLATQKSWHSSSSARSKAVPEHMSVSPTWRRRCCLRGRAQLRAAVEGAYISTPDGMPLVWILRRRGYAATEKLTGADLMPLLARAGARHGLRHFLYGWTNRMSQAAGRGLVDAVPGSLVVGHALSTVRCGAGSRSRRSRCAWQRRPPLGAAVGIDRRVRQSGTTGRSRNCRPSSRRHVHTFCGSVWVRRCKRNGWRWSPAASASR